MKDNNTFIKNIVEMLIKKIFYIYELLILIIFDRGSQFVIIILKSFYKRFDIQIKLFIIFYFKTNKQTKRNNQNLKRYLRIYYNHIQND